MFAVKGPRYVTHLKKLVGTETAVANFVASGLLALGPTLGPILWQLPAVSAFDAPRLTAFFASLPRSTAEAAVLGARHDEKLAADRVFLGAAVYVYFDNDARGHAPWDAVALRRMVDGAR